MVSVTYSGNEIRAITKIGKKYKLGCQFTSELARTDDLCQLIRNPRLEGMKYGIVASPVLMSGMKFTAKDEYTLNFNDSMVTGNGVAIPTQIEPFPDNLYSIYEKIMNVLTKYEDDSLRIDNIAVIPVDPVLAFCKTLGRDEGMKIIMSYDKIRFEGCDHEESFIELPIDPCDGREIKCCMGNDLIKPWLSLASKGSVMNLRIERDHPCWIAIKINGCWFETIIAPRIENDW